jgi:hypothetical protein
MPNPSAARGFMHVGSVSQQSFNGGLSEYRIASGTANTLTKGDAVRQLSTGYIDRVTGGTQSIRGFLVGVRYLGVDGLPKFDNKWVGGTVTFGGQDAVALVIDDPTAIVEARFTGATVPGAVAQQGELYQIADAAGSAVTGLSAQGVDSTTASTSAGQFRFLGYVARPDNDPASVNGIGRFALVLHDFRVQTGV